MQGCSVFVGCFWKVTHFGIDSFNLSTMLPGVSSAMICHRAKIWLSLFGEVDFYPVNSGDWISSSKQHIASDLILQILSVILEFFPTAGLILCHNIVSFVIFTPYNKSNIIFDISNIVLYCIQSGDFHNFAP